MDQDIPQNPNVTYFAKTNHRGSENVFGLKRTDRRQHAYVVGKSGTGKSAMLKNMIAQNIEHGEGVSVVDPHGELAEEVLELIPAHRKDDVVYFNPADTEYHIGFNVLEVPDPKYKHLIAAGLMSVFKKIWANTWSARMEYIMNNAILALIDTPGSTLLGIPRLLVDQDYRQMVIKNIKDPVVRAFWVNEYESWQDKFRNEAIAPIQNKVGQFLSTSITRNIVGQSKSTINIFDIMNNQKILVVNVSKGRIGEDNSALLGSMIITKLQLAAMERVRIPEEQRKDFYLYVDEFQNFVTESFASILSEARKYRLCLTIAHQYIAQLTTPDSTAVRDAVFGNVGTMISFRVGASDAEFLEPEFAPEFAQEDFVNLPNYHIYLRLMVDGVTSKPFSAKTLPPFEVEGSKAIAREIIDHSRQLYARPKEEVEDEIHRWTYSKPGEDDSSGEAEENNANVAERAEDATQDTDGNYRVKCSIPDCDTVAVVPFQPQKGRPVYCKTHIDKIKAGDMEPIKMEGDKKDKRYNKDMGTLASMGIAFKESELKKDEKKDEKKNNQSKKGKKEDSRQKVKKSTKSKKTQESKQKKENENDRTTKVYRKDDQQHKSTINEQTSAKQDKSSNTQSLSSNISNAEKITNTSQKESKVSLDDLDKYGKQNKTKEQKNPVNDKAANEDTKDALRQALAQATQTSDEETTETTSENVATTKDAYSSTANDTTHDTTQSFSSSEESITQENNSANNTDTEDPLSEEMTEKVSSPPEDIFNNTETVASETNKGQHSTTPRNGVGTIDSNTGIFFNTNVTSEDTEKSNDESIFQSPAIGEDPSPESSYTSTTSHEDKQSASWPESTSIENENMPVKNFTKETHSVSTNEDQSIEENSVPKENTAFFQDSGTTNEQTSEAQPDETQSNKMDVVANNTKTSAHYREYSEEVQEQNAELQKMKEEAEQRANEAKKEVEEERKKREQAEKEAREKADQLIEEEKKRRELEEDSQNTKSRLESIEQEKQSIEEKMQEESSNKEQLEQEKSQLDEERKSLEDEKSRIENEKEEIKQKMEELEQETNERAKQQAEEKQQQSNEENDNDNNGSKGNQSPKEVPEDVLKRVLE